MSLQLKKLRKILNSKLVEQATDIQNHSSVRSLTGAQTSIGSHTYKVQKDLFAEESSW